MLPACRLSEKAHRRLQTQLGEDLIHANQDA